jgi:hypothetical protein
LKGEARTSFLKKKNRFNSKAAQSNPGGFLRLSVASWQTESMAQSYRRYLQRLHRPSLLARLWRRLKYDFRMTARHREFGGDPSDW